MKLIGPFSCASGSRAGYALRAWLVATAPSLVYFFTLVSIGADSLQPPAGALDVAIAGYSILLAPVLETALMLLLASLLSWLIPRSERVRIVLLAAIFALAHVYGGGWRQVIASFWPSLVYSVTLVTWLKHSVKDAFVLTALVHALYNLSIFAVGALGVLIAGFAL